MVIALAAAAAAAASMGWSFQRVALGLRGVRTELFLGAIGVCRGVPDPDKSSVDVEHA